MPGESRPDRLNRLLVPPFREVRDRLEWQRHARTLGA
jgi:hypothetical protein